jgi:hypothetical protein
VAAFIFIGRLAYRATPTPANSRVSGGRVIVDALFLASLVVLTWVHEDWAWQFVTDGRRGLGPMSVALLPTSLALLVWPARFFYQLDTPFDDGPRWRFVLLVATFAAFTLTGVR